MPDEQHLPGGIGGSAECQLCPICVLLQALATAKPEVTQHLLVAAREVTLALKAVVDAQAHAAERATAPTGLRRIDLD